MTEQEFKSTLVPVLSGLFPRLVAMHVKPAKQHDMSDIERFEAEKIKAREKNRRAWFVFQKYTLEVAVDACRKEADENIEVPQYQGTEHVLDRIRKRLRNMSGESAEKSFDPSKWTWQDECTLFHILAIQIRSGREIPELDIARQRIGKNPQPYERDEAYSRLCGHVNDARQRAMVNMQWDSADAEAKHPYPKDACDKLRKGREQWLHDQEVLALEADRVMKEQELLTVANDLAGLE